MATEASDGDDHNTILPFPRKHHQQQQRFRRHRHSSSIFRPSEYPFRFLLFFMAFIHSACSITMVNISSSSRKDTNLTATEIQKFPIKFDNITSSSYEQHNHSQHQHHRQKRQWGGYQQQQQQQMCPPQCFACSPMHCQAYQCIQPQVMGCNMVRCCCRPAIIVHPQPDLKTACDGEEAVAACLNGLCGQGFFCNSKKFCCRCPAGKSLGNCMNGLCPAGYACNSNNYCCAVGSGSVLGPCANGKCPEGYQCGAGDLCYASSGNTLPTTATSRTVNRRNYPQIRRNRPRWSPPEGRKRKRTQQRGRSNGGWSWSSYGDDWPEEQFADATAAAWEGK